MKLISKIVFLILSHILLIVYTASSQRTVIDSLNTILRTAKTDTVKVNALHGLAIQYTDTIPDTCMAYLNRSYSLALKINYKKGMADNLYSLGQINFKNDNFERALSSLDSALHLREELKDKKGIADCLNARGNVCLWMGDYDKAIALCEKSLALQLESKDPQKIALCYKSLGSAYISKADYSQSLKYYLRALKTFPAEDKEDIWSVLNNIGSVYVYLKDYSRALEYYKQALNAKSDKLSTSTIYSNMGTIYLELKDYKQAEEFFLRALKLSEETDRKYGVLTSLASLGELYRKEKRFEKATQCYLRSLEIAEEIGDKKNICNINLVMAEMYLEQKDARKSLELMEKALPLAKEIGAEDLVSECYAGLSEIYTALKDYRKSLEYYKLYTQTEDSIFSKEKTQSIAELQTRYETEKKEKEIQLLTKDKELKEKSLQEQQIIRTALICVLTLLFILSGVLYKRYRYKQKANMLLEKQKKEIQLKNKHITDSINYAKTIQEAILPSPQTFKSFFPQSFIFHRPKAIVSGDFYWVAEKGGKIICAVADCTGHGVPGAFMSLLGNNMLDNVVKKMDVTNPALILEYLHEAIIAVMTQGREHSTGSGMDIALVSFDKTMRRLEYAGAHNSIFLVRKGELKEIKADKTSIGFLKKEPPVYTNHTQELEEGDLIYLFSDGYPDQMGEAERRKFYYQPFKELLLSIHQLEMQDQKKKLNETITSWQGNYEQTDDMLVIGIRITDQY